MPPKPMTLDRAVDETKAFNHQVREWLREEVKAAVDPLSKEVRGMARALEGLTTREESTAKAVANMATDFNRFASWATQRGLREDMVDRKLDRLIERMPDLAEALKQPPERA